MWILLGSTRFILLIAYTTIFIKVLGCIVAQKRPLAYGKHRHKVGGDLLEETTLSLAVFNFLDNTVIWVAHTITPSNVQ